MMLSRREFVSSAALGPFVLFPGRAAAQRKTLKIAQWTHFVPGYNEWFANVYAKEWGRQHDTNVVVDQIPADQINARAAAEVAAGQGHDLFMFPWPPAIYHRQAIDHTEIYQAIASRHGNVNKLGHLSTFQPRTKRYFAVADSWIPAVVHFFEDYWAEANTPFGPSNYDTLRAGSRKIRALRGVPCGLALAPGLESNITLQTMLFAYRTAVQDDEGNVALNRSYMTIQALKFAKGLYEDGGTPDALNWGPAGNVRAMLARKASCTVNSISLLRAAERENPELAKNILLRPPLLGPGGVWAVPHVTSCSLVWNFAENKDAAQQFLVDLIDNSATVFEKSESCNFPIYQNTLPNILGRLSHDPQGGPLAKYEELKDALKWTRSLCYPGYATPEAMEAFHAAVVPRMFLSAIKGSASPEDAARAAEKELNSIYDKWKEA